MNFRLNDNLHLENGYLLISQPMLEDPNFQRSVILMCEHNQEGSFGFVLNHITDVHIGEAIELEMVKNTLFLGGPVERERLHFIHRFENLEGAIHLKDDIYWGGDFEQLQEKGTLGQIDESNCRFLAGYSGWGTGQLMDELKSDTWIISKESPSLLFDIEPQNLWHEILRRMGGRYKMFSNYPINPIFN